MKLGEAGMIELDGKNKTDCLIDLCYTLEAAVLTNLASIGANSLYTGCSKG